MCFYLNSDLFYVFLILVYFCLNFDFLCISYFHFGCVLFQVVCLFGNINFSIKLVSHDLESVFKLCNFSKFLEFFGLFKNSVIFINFVSG